MSDLNWKHEISIRGLKALDIAYIFTLGLL